MMRIRLITPSSANWVKGLDLFYVKNVTLNKGKYSQIYLSRFRVQRFKGFGFPVEKKAGFSTGVRFRVSDSGVCCHLKPYR